PLNFMPLFNLNSNDLRGVGLTKGNLVFLGINSKIPQGEKEQFHDGPRKRVLLQILQFHTLKARCVGNGALVEPWLQRTVYSLGRINGLQSGGSGGSIRNRLGNQLYLFP